MGLRGLVQGPRFGHFSHEQMAKVQLHLSAQVPDRTFWKRSGLSLIPCMSIALTRGDWLYCSSHTMSQGLFHHHPVSDRHHTDDPDESR